MAKAKHKQTTQQRVATRRSKERAARAENMLMQAYGDDITAIGAVDALTDLMHLAHRNKLDFDNDLRQARGHFDAEINGEE